MTSATRQRSRAALVNQEVLGQASAFLQELPKKPKEGLTLREVVGQLQDSLKAALTKGYSYQDLAKMLSEQGIEISALTLKHYISTRKQQATKNKPGRTGKSGSDEPVTVEQTSVETVSTPESPVSTPQGNSESTQSPTQSKRGQSTSTKTSKGGRKTDVAKNLSKPGTIAKATRTRKSSNGKAASKPAITGQEQANP